jgi:nitroreductase
MAGDGVSIPGVKVAEGVEGVLGAIAGRWSPRAFSERSVEVGTLRVLLEAARWAASSFNEQPWRFLVARKEEAEGFARMLSILVPKNQEWAKGAAVLMLTVARKTFSRNNAPNRHALHDTGAALAQLAVQAASMGLQAHAMAGFDQDKARLVLKVPAEFEMGAAVAVGYPGDAAMLPEPFRALEEGTRVRKGLGEIVFGAGFGEASAVS